MPRNIPFTFWAMYAKRVARSFWRCDFQDGAGSPLEHSVSRRRQATDSCSQWLRDPRVNGQGEPAQSISQPGQGVLPPDTPDHRLRNTQDVSNFLADSIHRISRVQLDPKVANSVGYLASVLLRFLKQGRTEQRVAPDWRSRTVPSARFTCPIG